MSFEMQDQTDQFTDEVMNEINMTPMVDVMLVLLIIFIITVPVINHSVNVDLPQASTQAQTVQPAAVRLSIGADGGYFYNDAKLADNELNPRLQTAARQDPQPELHIRGDKNVRYERVAQAMAAAQLAGLRKIGFITEPKS